MAHCTPPLSKQRFGPKMLRIQCLALFRQGVGVFFNGKNRTWFLKLPKHDLPVFGQGRCLALYTRFSGGIFKGHSAGGGIPLFFFLAQTKMSWRSLLTLRCSR